MSDSGHIFISYKTEERELAFKVRDRIQAWGHTTWLDVDRLQAGANWANHIDQALKTCRACVGIVTPLSLGSRYVTNEWDVAIMKGKTLLPLMFEATEPHYKYIDIQYIDFTMAPSETAYAQLQSRLEGLQAEVRPAVDPYSDYLQSLYDRINAYLSAKLIKSLRDEQGRPDPIQLGVESTDDAVDVLFQRRVQVDPLFLAGGLTEEPMKQFDDFGQAFEFFDGRILLLGDPGAGKTVTLLHYARDALVRRRNNPNAPLPILVLIPTWDGTTPIEEWIASAYDAPERALEIIRNGEALLVLDGLDELGTEKKIYEKGGAVKETFDPRARFIQQLPDNNQVLVTSRTKEFEDIGQKIALNGAITLRSLNTAQIAHYLDAQPELLKFVKSENSLQEWLDTPLLLSFFALAYEGMTPSEQKQLTGMLNNASEFRSTIFDGYVRERYKHEGNKYQLRGDQMSMSIDDMLTVLGRVALRNMMSFDKYDKSSHGAYLQPLIAERRVAGEPYDKIRNEMATKLVIFDERSGVRVRTMIKFDELQAVELACQLDLMLVDEEQYQFIHLLLRNHLAYQECLKVLARPADESSSAEQSDFDVVAAAIALRDIKDPRAVPLLERHLDNDRWFNFGYHEAANPSVEVRQTLLALQELENP